MLLPRRSCFNRRSPRALTLIVTCVCLAQVFMEVGAKELVFIERSGLLFGFMFGCLQTCLWYFYQEDWVLPIGGLVVRNRDFTCMYTRRCWCSVINFVSTFCFCSRGKSMRWSCGVFLQPCAMLRPEFLVLFIR